ncbi:MAG: transketolase [Candidatus Doudnabacteria bacterium]|nr:transketolase [Candidatus Doudnabacteria bacterium]
MKNNLEQLAKLVRYYILTSTTAAGSGHPSSSLSATDIMVELMFGRSQNKADGSANADERGNGSFFRADLNDHENPNNDRLIFSKGHASPLFYALYAAAGQARNDVELNADEHGKLHRAIDPEELLTLRKFTSRLEGHPTSLFPFTEVPTGSLGQGLSVGVGMALNAKLDGLDYRTYVLMGDSEIAEGSVWEAMAVASFYNLNNLVAVLDINRLGQRGETMLGVNTEIYKQRAESFGWNAIVIDGHNFEEITKAFETATSPQPSPQKGREKPIMIIARTIKGKGVSFIEDKDGWHGKALSAEELNKALAELGEVDKSLVGEVALPERSKSQELGIKVETPKFTNYEEGKKVATRKAYGNALANLVEVDERIVVLDAETSNSTYADSVKKNHPEKFVECFIAEQNMVGMALGFSRRGKIPFVSTFAAFLSRAFDQIRMSALAQSNIKFIGSHAGVSIGEDGSSQMGLEEIAMFRALPETVVLYPSDAVSTEKLVLEAAKHKGNVYIQTTRKETEIIYRNDKIDGNDKNEQELMQQEFKIGGSCTLKSSDKDIATVIGAGVTLHEALAAYEELKKEGINIRVIDLYSVKPLDLESLKKATVETKNIIVVEDNHHEGGIYEAVAGALASVESLSSYKVASLSVTKLPRSGKPDELLAYEEIDKNAIIKLVKTINNSI